MMNKLSSTKQSDSNDDNLAPKHICWTPMLVEKFWRGFARTRLVEYSFSRQAGRSLIVAIDHLLPREGEILDYGAGDGDLVKLMCERGLKVFAFEPSKERSKTLQQRLESCNGFLGVIEGDVSKRFDMVIATEVIEHVLDEQLDDCLHGIFSMVRPGGLLIVTTPNNEDLDLGMAYCPVSNILFHRWQHVRSFTDRSLAALLTHHGFEEVVTHHVEFNDLLFVPYDKISGSVDDPMNLPSHIVELRANRPVKIGGETNLLYIGRRAY